MQFIETDDGFIPLHRVIRIQPPGKTGRALIWYDDASDVEARTLADLPLEFEIKYAETVPASPGFDVVGFIDGSDEVFTTPVVAWKVIDGTAIPVTPDDADMAGAVLCPDGQVIEPYIATYESIETYRAERKKLQSEA